MFFADYSFAGRITATPGVCGALKRSARLRRSLVRCAFELAFSGDECVTIRDRVRYSPVEVDVRRYRGGVIARLAYGANYQGACWRVVDPATGIPGAPAFAIRRGTGELIGPSGVLSLMPEV